MTLHFTDIPDADATETTERTQALTALGALAKRRTVLRGMALAGATIGATALGWSPLGRSDAASAETSPSGLLGWDANDCKDAYPNGYNEQPDNVGVYQSQPGACFGGYYMGSTMCDSTGWHRADSVRNSWIQTTSYRPISSACGATTTKNAWRWTVNGVTYRCSDGTMSIKYWGLTWYTYLTICRARV
ncbi:MAG: hypothetical protein LCH98_03920 [Actinobacteria bacterium]|nr:hypothetical protein [Actinomycetota bacterium]